MLRVPGPRPYEEVKSILELIRRQLFQSDILLELGDSIKLEAEVEVEVDPFQSMTQPTSVSPLGTQSDKLKGTAQAKKKQPDEPSVNLPSENNSGKLISMHLQTHFPHKNKFNESDQESTRDLTLKNVAIKVTSGGRQTYLPHKRKPQNDKESAIDSPPKKVSSSSKVRQTYLPILRKSEHQIPEHYSIQHIKNIKPEVVLPRIPSELLNQQKSFKSETTSSGIAKMTIVASTDKANMSNAALTHKANMSNVESTDKANMSKVASTDNVQIKSGALLVTPEYLGLSESDLIKKYNIKVKGRRPKRLLIQVHNSKVRSQILQQTKEKLPASLTDERNTPKNSV